MRIAVTGGTGFIGRYIVRQLVEAGHELRCWRRESSDVSGFEAQQTAIEWVDGRLGDAAAAAELIRNCDAVVHAALWRPGQTFRGGEGDVVEFAERNLIGSLQLIDAGLRAAVERFVFISTCAVHERILDDRQLDETHPLWPTSHYGAHKAAIEKFIHSYGLGHGFPICAVRPTGVYGAARPVEQSKWFELVNRVVKGDTVECRGGGKEVHAADVARAVELLLTAEGICGEAFNCCDMYISQYDVATLARQMAASDAEIVGEQTRPKNQIETGKIRRLGMQFGGRPLLESTVQQLVEHCRGLAMG